ncbi:MAG: hypothetical protein KJ066_17950 [Acidobacteria bacterium]|nr:hypothetical protein [Acidobacteriota bacterium]
MKKLILGLGLAVALAAPVAPAAADGVSITLRDGLVTIVADNATPRQILAEWARVGQVKVVNGDKLPGGPITLRLDDVPERQALDTILRSAAGFMVADRAAYVADASRFDRIMVLPTSNAPAAAPVSAAGRRGPVFPQPAMQPTEDVVANPDMMVGEDNMTVDDPQSQGQPMAPVVSPYRGMNITTDGQGQPPETNFDYANPQRMFEERRRQMLEQQGLDPTDPTMMPAQPGLVPAPAPGGTQAFPGAPIGATRPGEIVNPPTPPSTPGAPTTPPAGFNPYNLGPYGLPVGAAPGTGTTPQMEPDRAKYINPYAPQPTPKPPDRQDD